MMMVRVVVRSHGVVFFSSSCLQYLHAKHILEYRPDAQKPDGPTPSFPNRSMTPRNHRELLCLATPLICPKNSTV